MNQEQAEKLRAPFPPEQIGQLPRGGVKLDFVGHAATTDRLLQADHDWTWEPMGRDLEGNPVVVTDKQFFSDQFAKVGLWMRVQVGGVWTPGFGEGKNVKEAISDGIRNAAMRRGVALDLWSKEDLHGSDERAPAKSAGASKPAQPSSSSAARDGGSGSGGASAVAPPDPPDTDEGLYAGDPVTRALFDELLRLSKEFGANTVTVGKSVRKNREATEGYVVKHREWLERQIETVKANIANKQAMAESKFQPPAGATERAA